MRDDVETIAPGIGREAVQNLDGIEDRGDGVAEQGLPTVLPGVPERPAPGVPLLLHAQVERIKEGSRVAVGELTVFEQDRTINGEQEGQKQAGPTREKTARRMI
jgi:hypothetical protein